MADTRRHLRALEHAAADAQRVLEDSIGSADESWTDGARRQFEAEHLAAIRSDARHLRIDLAAINQSADQAMRQLMEDR